MTLSILEWRNGHANPKAAVAWIPSPGFGTGFPPSRKPMLRCRLPPTFSSRTGRGPPGCGVKGSCERIIKKQRPKRHWRREQRQQPTTSHPWTTVKPHDIGSIGVQSMVGQLIGSAARTFDIRHIGSKCWFGRPIFSTSPIPTDPDKRGGKQRGPRGPHARLALGDALTRRRFRESHPHSPKTIWRVPLQVSLISLVRRVHTSKGSGRCQALWP